MRSQELLRHLVNLLERAVRRRQRIKRDGVMDVAHIARDCGAHREGMM